MAWYLAKRFFYLCQGQFRLVAFLTHVHQENMLGKGLDGHLHRLHQELRRLQIAEMTLMAPNSFLQYAGTPGLPKEFRIMVVFDGQDVGIRQFPSQSIRGESKIRYHAGFDRSVHITCRQHKTKGVSHIIMGDLQGFDQEITDMKGARIEMNQKSLSLQSLDIS